MKPIEGRLQTAEHLLARTLERMFPETKFVIARFKENVGHLEIFSKTDMRKVDQERLQDEVNLVIERKLKVRKYMLGREEAEKEFDLDRVPSSVEEVRIVEIEGFDKTPCKDPHVENTGEIGYFEILKIEKAGKDRYGFVFQVQQKNSIF